MIQPPVQSCVITVSNSTGGNSSTRPCEERRPVPFDVMLSSDTDIRYNITIENFAGVSNDIDSKLNYCD